MHVESQISRLKMSDDVPFLSTLGRNHDLGEFPMWRRFLQKIVSTTSKLNSEPWNNSSETPEPSWAAWSSLWARGTKAWHENLGWCFAPKILQIQRHEPASDRLHCRSIIFAKIFAEDFKLLAQRPRHSTRAFGHCLLDPTVKSFFPVSPGFVALSEPSLFFISSMGVIPTLVKYFSSLIFCYQW